MQEEIIRAIDILKKGGVILYPTDTIWGIGCNAFNEQAIQKVYNIKNRDQKKSLIILVDTEKRLQELVDVPALAWDLIDLSEKPLTIIYEEPRNLPASLISSENTIAIRLTKDPFCKKLIAQLNAPIISTSANLSGESNPENFEMISDKILDRVDYIINLRKNEKLDKRPSSIVQLSKNGKVKIIRE